MAEVTIMAERENATSSNITKNGTWCNEEPKERSHALVLLTSILFAPVIYLMIALVGYGLRKIMTRRRMTRTLVNVRFDGRSKIILVLLFIVQLACLTRQIAAIFFSRTYYEYLQYFNLTTGIGYHIISIILWIRQQHIYQKPGIRRMATTKVKFLSYFALFCICISIIAMTVNELLYSTEGKCDDDSFMTHRIIWLVMLMFDVIFQIILFALFVHPLLEHKRQMKLAKISSFRTLRPAILKILYAAIACFIANIVLGITLTTLKTTGLGLGTPISSFSLLLQTIAIIASYSDWRVRVFPFLYCTRNGKSVFPTTTTNNTQQKPSVVSETIS